MYLIDSGAQYKVRRIVLFVLLEKVLFIFKLTKFEGNEFILLESISIKGTTKGNITSALVQYNSTQRRLLSNICA